MTISTLQSKVRLLADSVRGLAELGAGTRNVFNDIFASTLDTDSDIYGVWSVWEANALDGKDQEFRNAPGHDRSGRYAPFWVRDCGRSISVEPNTNYDTPQLGDYFHRPISSGQEITVMASEYYMLSGERKVFTYHAVPISLHGIYRGVIGIDVLPERMDAEPFYAASIHNPLSRRELEVLSWIAEGKGNQELAVILGISVHTVKRHVERILSKLGVENRQTAARLFLDKRLPTQVEAGIGS